MKKQLIITIFSLSTLFLIIFSCKNKETECLDCDVCEEFKGTKNNLNEILVNKNQELFPFFNPNNSEEFIYIKFSNNRYTLIKYNIKHSTADVLLTEADIASQPKWGKNGIVLFTDSYQRLHLINSNGTNHRVLPIKGAIRYPEWKNDTIVTIEYTQKDLIPPHFFANLNILTNKLDVSKNNDANVIYNANVNEYAFHNTVSLKAVANNLAYTIIDSVYGIETIFDCKWGGDGSYIYFSTNKTGLFKVNKNTKAISKIKNACDTRYYRSLSISPDGKKMLVERVDAQLLKGSPEEDAGIYLMDIDGKNEVKLFQ